MTNEYGTVISTFEGPSTRRFQFVINGPAPVRRGQFVQIEVEDGKLIGRVADIFKTNRYFMRPETVKEYESSGKPMDNIFPVGEWEHMVADVAALGVYSNSSFTTSNIPPSPGARVIEPDSNIVTEFFGLDKNGLHIGHLPYHNLQVNINTTRLLQKHLAILAISGAGKSFLSAIIIEELLKREPEQGQMAIVVVDTHGEYTSFAEDGLFSGKTKVFDSGEIKIGLANISPHSIGEYLPNLSYTQLRELGKIMARFGRKAYGMEDLLNAVEGSEALKTATKDVLLSELGSLANTGLFGFEDYPPMDDLARQGGLTVIDVSSIVDLRRKQLIVAYIARKMFNARRNGIIPPFVLVIEEAHQFVPEQAKKEIAVSRGILQTIAREGRKFLASLCLISQRPIQLSTTALSQCNTHIILRITNPYDLDHIGKSSEGLTRDVLRQISSLPVGTGIIVGEAVNFPLFVKFRKRVSKESDKGLNLEKGAQEFYKKIAQKKKDAKAFM